MGWGRVGGGDDNWVQVFLEMSKAVTPATIWFIWEE